VFGARVQLIVHVLLIALGAAWRASAVELDLTAIDSYGLINGALFREASHGAGSGMYTNLFSIRGGQGTPSYESGFNTGASTQPLDASSGRNLLLDDVTITTIGSEVYAIFGLDANENNGYISLNEVEVWVSQTASLSSYSALQASATRIYEMDAGTDSAIAINAGGSGASDMEFCLPYLAFTGCNTSTTYVYLYAEMGGYNSDIGAITVAQLDWSDGFEEWAIPQGLPTLPPNFTVPEPTAALLTVVGSCALLAGRRRRTSQATTPGDGRGRTGTA